MEVVTTQSRTMTSELVIETESRVSQHDSKGEFMQHHTFVGRRLTVLS
jgi:hypothetical protein